MYCTPHGQPQQGYGGGGGGGGQPAGYGRAPPGGAAGGGYPPSGPGYPPPHRPQVPPPGADPTLWSWFAAVDSDGSGQLTAEELQRALINGDWSQFNTETCRLMINMFDLDNTGKIEFNEFAALWKYIEQWKTCFQSFDRDSSGSIDKHELSQALRTFGFNLSMPFVERMIRKFDTGGVGAVSKNKQPQANTNFRVTFDNFIQACVTVKTLTDAFIKMDTDRKGWVTLGYEQFLELVINNR